MQRASMPEVPEFDIDDFFAQSTSQEAHTFELKIPRLLLRFQHILNQSTPITSTTTDLTYHNFFEWHKKDFQHIAQFEAGEFSGPFFS